MEFPARRWRETVLAGLLIVILPTAGFFFVAERFGFLGPRLNLDLLVVYVLAVLVASRAPRLAAVVAMLGVAFALAVQTLLGVGAIYIDDPALIREYVAFIEFWPWRLISFWASAAAAVLAIFYLLLRRADLRRASIWPAAALLIVLIAVDLVTRTPQGHALVGTNFATSSTVRMFKLGRSWATTKGFRSEPLAAPMMVDAVRLQMPSRVMSLSVEALGLAHDPRFNEAVFAPMRAALGDAFSVNVGRHQFKGATLSGELRELCAMRTAGTPTRADAAHFSKRCLPRILSDAGYRSLAIHGNSGFFYNRFEIYPALGFDETLFRDDFVETSGDAMICTTRAFEGICDRVATRAALRFIAAHPKSYAHIMTLDTHFPLGPTPLGGYDCGRTPGLEREDLCLYANQMANLLKQVAEEIRAAPAPPDVVYIFGDHAPPYAVASERMFFDREHVPFITIRRR